MDYSPPQTKQTEPDLTSAPKDAPSGSVKASAPDSSSSADSDSSPDTSFSATDTPHPRPEPDLSLEAKKRLAEYARSGLQVVYSALKVTQTGAGRFIIQRQEQRLYLKKGDSETRYKSYKWCLNNQARNMINNFSVPERDKWDGVVDSFAVLYINSTSAELIRFKKERTREAIYESLDTMADNALNQLRKFITVNYKSWAELEAESGNTDVSVGVPDSFRPNNWIDQKN